MATFVLQATGAREAARDLRGVGERATQLRPVFDDLIGALLTGERKLFDRNGGGGRNAWPPNRKSTIARKLARGQDPRPMRATGSLERMLTQKGASGQIARGGGTILDFGARHVGGNVAQFTKNPARRRQVVKMLPTTKREVRQIILDHIVEGLDA